MIVREPRWERISRAISGKTHLRAKGIRTQRYSLPTRLAVDMKIPSSKDAIDRFHSFPVPEWRGKVSRLALASRSSNGRSAMTKPMMKCWSTRSGRLCFRRAA